MLAPGAQHQLVRRLRPEVQAVAGVAADVDFDARQPLRHRQRLLPSPTPHLGCAPAPRQGPADRQAGPQGSTGSLT